MLSNTFIIDLDNTTKGKLIKLLIKTNGKKKANTLFYMTDSTTNKFFAFKVQLLKWKLRVTDLDK